MKMHLFLRHWSIKAKIVRNDFQSTKLNGDRVLKSTLTWDMKIQCLVFAQLVFNLSLVLDFLIVCFVIPFMNGVVYHVSLYTLSFWFYRVLYLRDCISLTRNLISGINMELLKIVSLCCSYKTMRCRELNMLVWK